MVYNRPATPESNAAYRAGLCIDCRTVRYSAGRPRCAACHAALTPKPLPRPIPRRPFLEVIAERYSGMK